MGSLLPHRLVSPSNSHAHLSLDVAWARGGFKRSNQAERPTALGSIRDDCVGERNAVQLTFRLSDLARPIGSAGDKQPLRRATRSAVIWAQNKPLEFGSGGTTALPLTVRGVRTSGAGSAISSPVHCFL